MIGSVIALAGHGLISSTLNENVLCMLLFCAWFISSTVQFGESNTDLANRALTFYADQIMRRRGVTFML